MIIFLFKNNDNHIETGNGTRVKATRPTCYMLTYIDIGVYTYI